MTRRADSSVEDDVRALLVLMPRIVARAKRRRAPAELAEFDLTPRHLSLFAVLLDAPLTVNQLADTLDLAPTTVSLMIGELSRKGLLRREEDPDDRRRRVVSIPEKYREAIDVWLGDSASAWHHVLDSLSVAERSIVVRALTDYERRLRED